MKRILLTLAMLSMAAAASAQYYYPDAVNSEMLRFGHRTQPQRKEIVLPCQVNGYNLYKADLHTHSVFSDGSVTPQFRVKEAWLEGLDVMAVTEHIEYRPHEKVFGSYLQAEGPFNPDLNTSVNIARKEAEIWDVFIIPGAEITRSGRDVGHFNALFTKDNNAIYHEDPVQAIRNAKSQGALVMHNHPGWTRTSIDFTPTEQIAYGEGLIDGVEVVNYVEFYPGIIDRVRDHGLFIAANSDIHASAEEEYNADGFNRPITLIFATERTEAGLREALEAGRTLALAFNTMCGSEALLVDFFKAAVSVKWLSENVFMLTNNTSIPFVIQQEGRNQERINPFSTVRFDGPKSFVVHNMFCGKDAHPIVELSF